MHEELAGGSKQSHQNLPHNAEMEEVERLPTEVLEVETSSAKKKVARRTKNFSHQEDEVICSAWINVSQEAITGTNTSGGYWKRFTDYFDKYKPDGSQRTQVALQHRWKIIQKEVNRFCGYLSEIERRNENGKVAEDRLIKDAMNMFEGLQKHPFRFTHCWILLRNEMKWCERVTGARSERVVTEEQPQNMCTSGAPEVTASPEGRDSCKKKHACNYNSSADSTACVEVLERMSTEVLEVETTSAKKKVARRTKNFSHQEDEVICSAWINVSQGAITDTDQTCGGYWKRFTDYFDKYKPDGSQRTQIALQHRWTTIQKEVNRFCGYLSKIERHNESGKVAEDRLLKDAMNMFEGLQKHPFQFTHCWILLRNERKWCEKVTGARSERVVTEELPQNICISGALEVTTRPEGSDSCQKKHACNYNSSADSTACVEVLERMPTEVLEVETTSAKKKVARRTKNFSHQEDEVICSAWINVSQGAITDTDQTSGGYWKRFTNYFDKYKPDGSQRTQIALQHRWTTIQKEVNRFCGYLSEIVHHNDSGKVAEDRLKDAMNMFEGLQKHPFQFTHCWILLRNERKWCERVTGARSERVVTEEQPQNMCTSGAPEVTARPEGRDSCKKKRASNYTSSDSTACVEVLERMTKNRKLVDVKCDEQYKELLARKDRKLELLEKELEFKIMAVDIDKVPEFKRAYYLNLQRQIMEKSNGSNNSSTQN